MPFRTRSSGGCASSLLSQEHPLKLYIPVHPAILSLPGSERSISSNPATIHLSSTGPAFASLFPKTLPLLPRSGCVCGFFLWYELVYSTNLTCLHFLRVSLCCDMWLNTSEKVRRIPGLPPDPELGSGQGKSALGPYLFWSLTQSL